MEKKRLDKIVDGCRTLKRISTANTLLGLCYFAKRIRISNILLIID